MKYARYVGYFTRHLSILTLANFIIRGLLRTRYDGHAAVGGVHRMHICIILPQHYIRLEMLMDGYHENGYV